MIDQRVYDHAYESVRVNLQQTATIQQMVILTLGMEKVLLYQSTVHQLVKASLHQVKDQPVASALPENNHCIQVGTTNTETIASEMTRMVHLGVAKRRQSQKVHTTNKVNNVAGDVLLQLAQHLIWNVLRQS